MHTIHIYIYIYSILKIISILIIFLKPQTFAFLSVISKSKWQQEYWVMNVCESRFVANTHPKKFKHPKHPRQLRMTSKITMMTTVPVSEKNALCEVTFTYLCMFQNPGILSIALINKISHYKIIFVDLRIIVAM